MQEFIHVRIKHGTIENTYNSNLRFLKTMMNPSQHKMCKGGAIWNTSQENVQTPLILECPGMKNFLLNQ